MSAISRLAFFDSIDPIFVLQISLNCEDPIAINRRPLAVVSSESAINRGSYKVSEMESETLEVEKLAG